MGKLFGSGPEKLGNIAGAAIVASFVMLVGLVTAWFLVPDPSPVPFGGLVTLFGGIIAGALSCMLGKST